MEVKAIYRYARISPQKAREVTREIQGMDVNNALAILNYTPKKAALLIGKTLQSAIANATHNHSLDEETLFVKSVTATTGPSLKRIMPRARGSASPIKKRMAHITVVVAPKVETNKTKDAEAPKVVEVEAAAPAKKAAKKATKTAKAEAPAEGDPKPKRTRKTKES